MPPPPADSVASRLFLVPALRTQPDRRLVALVRDGYELAFEEIVRRYRAPLERFAAAIVGSRSEDVTQDAFSKALLALRGSENEIELRPWLYRIVRNTALNDIRDSPPPTEELGEAVAGGASAAVEAERREEISDLTERLRALPETQRAAIVMRELEGLSHEEIAAALGLSGGAARQAIHRARTTLRDGVGLLLPLPLLKFLLDGGGEAAAAGAGAGAGAAAGAAGAGGSAAALGGIGAAGAAKIGVAAVLVAGSVGAGVAVEQSNRSGDSTRPAATSTRLGDDSSNGGTGRSSGEPEPGDDHGGHGEAEPGDDHGGRGEGERGENRGRGRDDGGHRGRGDGDGGPNGSSGPGSGGSEDSVSGVGSSGPGSGGSGHPGSSGGSGSSGASGGSGSDSSGSSGGSSSGSSGRGDSGPSSDSSGSGGSDDSGSSGGPDDS